jgi:hypothetical protein
MYHPEFVQFETRDIWFAKQLLLADGDRHPRGRPHRRRRWRFLQPDAFAAQRRI